MYKLQGVHEAMVALAHQRLILFNQFFRFNSGNMFGGVDPTQFKKASSLGYSSNARKPFAFHRAGEACSRRKPCRTESLRAFPKVPRHKSEDADRQSPTHRHK